MGLSHGSPCSHVPGWWGQGQWGSRTLPGAATTPGRAQGWDGKGKAEGKGEKEKGKEGVKWPEQCLAAQGSVGGRAAGGTPALGRVWGSTSAHPHLWMNRAMALSGLAGQKPSNEPWLPAADRFQQPTSLAAGLGRGCDPSSPHSPNPEEKWGGHKAARPPCSSVGEHPQVRFSLWVLLCGVSRIW